MQLSERATRIPSVPAGSTHLRRKPIKPRRPGKASRRLCLRVCRRVEKPQVVLRREIGRAQKRARESERPDDLESPLIPRLVMIATFTDFVMMGCCRRAGTSREVTHAVAASARGVDYESKSVLEEARAHFMACARRVVRRGVGGAMS